MNSIKKILFLILFLCITCIGFADNHSTNAEIVEKAKEITKTLETKVEEEEDVPLNDPFAGNEGSNSSLNPDTGEERDPMSLYNFKLVGIMNGEYESYASLINNTGEVVTLQMNEELSPGIRLVGLKPEQAIFEKGENSFLIINFKNQIVERAQ